MILTDLEVDRDSFEQRTGWAIKPVGACKGHLCVPLPPGPLDARVLAERLGMPLVHDEEQDLWALGPETVGGRALTTAEAPDLELPDLDGNRFKLRSLHGRKVLLVAWASW
ncbi:MAG: hypothetical protein NVSMB4_05460 [Acidimicrobiales bacterium]